MGKRRNSFVVSDGSGDERPAKVSKKAAKGTSSSGGGGDTAVDADGNVFWELANSKHRRVTINKYGGKWLVNIREYYEDKSGEMKPGKKGISLSLEQYQSLVGFIPSINKQLRKNGVVLDGDVVDEGEEEDDEDEDEDEDEEGKPATVSRSSKKSSQKAKAQSKKKANIEATSDEGEDLEED
ncbi:unnamed protein product [Discula destructiva]